MRGGCFHRRPQRSDADKPQPDYIVRPTGPMPKMGSFLTAFPSKLDHHPAFALLREQWSPIRLWYYDTA